MDYMSARQILKSLPSLEVKPGLARTKKLLDAIGHPEKSFPAVHVAGTNGKGSVVAMLASVLGRAGYRVGRFTSPDLVDFRDRIAIDDKWISKQELATIVEQLRSQLAGEDCPTLFEAVTAIAFDHFARNRVDIAVVETGLGGRFDATNVVAPILCILTNVGRDHLQLLGSSLLRIAWEKAGIGKAQVPFLVGKLPPDVEQVVMEECRRSEAMLIQLKEPEIERIAFDWEHVSYKIAKGDLPRRIDSPLLGGCQLENLRITLQGIELMRKGGFAIPNTAVVRGLAEVQWPGRFEVMRRGPTIVLDGAHNLPGILALCEDVRRYVPDKKHRHLLFGVLADKEVVPICTTLFPSFETVTLTQSHSARAASVKDLAKLTSPLNSVVVESADVENGVSMACASLGEEDFLLIAGSITIIREARPYFLGGSV